MFMLECSIITFCILTHKRLSWDLTLYFFFLCDKQKWKGWQSRTYLRQARASSSPRVSVAKTYWHETKQKCRLSARSQWPSSAVEDRRPSNVRKKSDNDCLILEVHELKTDQNHSMCLQSLEMAWHDTHTHTVEMILQQLRVSHWLH